MDELPEKLYSFRGRVGPGTLVSLQSFRIERLLAEHLEPLILALVFLPDSTQCAAEVYTQRLSMYASACAPLRQP